MSAAAADCHEIPLHALAAAARGDGQKFTPEGRGSEPAIHAGFSGLLPYCPALIEP
jgi:hypothetical protein